MGFSRILLLTLVLHFTAGWHGFAQSRDQAGPILHYTLTIDSSDLSGYSVSIQISHAPHRFRLAMATHHEYDDRFWRWVTDFRVGSPATFHREDSAVWAITTSGTQVTVSYRIRLPPPATVHFSHRPFLSPYGGLVGDLHSFMYMVEHMHIPCRLTLRLPQGWQAATGVDTVPTKPLEFLAASAPQLLDAPILVGRLHTWNFVVVGVPYQVVYLSMVPTLGFDTLAFVTNIQKIIRQTLDLFGGCPYRHYSFLLEDGSAGALEHANSVTIGVPAAELASPTSDIYEEIAHEFFHAWNLMDIQPSGYTELNFGPQQRSPGVWFSEGVTMFYADLICRKTGLRVEDTSRLAHLASLIGRYYRDTGNMVFDPSTVSLASNALPGPLGDYSASTHLQGELLGTCLDILIRDASDGRHSLDDVMRWMYKRFGGKQSFRDSDIEAAVTAVCQCREAHSFFLDHLYRGKPIDFGRWLGLMGLHMEREWQPAKDGQGRLLPDNRVYAWQAPGDSNLRIGITSPNSCWAEAGLHTGDIITVVNGRAVHNRQDFQTVLGMLRIGDTVRIGMKGHAGEKSLAIPISGYTIPIIRVVEDAGASERQRRLFREWGGGAPPPPPLSNRKFLPG
jgi:predicted metalloprotease with PDZ domain